MASIANQRDKILQSAAIRFVRPPLPADVQATIDATRGVRMATTGLSFRVATNGTPAPASITLTARPTLADGPVTWAVVAGTATLGGTGNTRVLSAANMSTDLVTIRVSVQSGGSTHSDELTITRVYDGQHGSAGANGRRGTVNVSVAKAGPPWEDAAANNAILSFTGATARVEGDVVTQYANGWANTRYWTGAEWSPVAQVIDGNLVVRGTLWAEDIRSGGTISGNDVVGANSIFIGGVNDANALIGMYRAGVGAYAGLLQVRGAVRVHTSAGVEALEVNGNNVSIRTALSISASATATARFGQSFQVLGTNANNAFRVTETAIDGYLGQQLTRIGGGAYNATITPKNGDPAFNATVQFTAT